MKTRFGIFALIFLLTCCAFADVTVVSWNVRGYPEKERSDQRWFSLQLVKMAPDVLCVQEIANTTRTQTLKLKEKFASVAFTDSGDGQDNAIFVDEGVFLRDVAEAGGFQHPAETAFISLPGFDCTVVTVHLSFTDTARREVEKLALKKVVNYALSIDPDLILCGDFNIQTAEIQALAENLGLAVMWPSGNTSGGTTYAGSRYDWFLISPDLQAEEALTCEVVRFDDDRIGQSGVSDHYPIIARFKTSPDFQDKGEATIIPFLPQKHSTGAISANTAFSAPPPTRSIKATGNAYSQQSLSAEEPAASAGGSTIVYTTKSGSKYHKGSCSYLRKSKIPISLEEAKASGLTPCSRCKPPR